jgi:hypothetical protein
MFHPWANPQQAQFQRGDTALGTALGSSKRTRCATSRELIVARGVTRSYQFDETTTRESVALTV